MAVVTADRAQAVSEAAEPLSANLSWLLSQASYALTTELTAALEGLGISPRSFCVLSSAMGGEHSQTELAQAVGLDKTTMVVTVDELEAAGLAKRLPSAEDRRARMIAVTKAGERKVAKAQEVVDRIHADVLAAIPARERKAFLDALTQLVCGRLSEATACAQPVRRRQPRT
jgi:MarR family transcriptional regulator, transcriptional regulator for hemolysin